MKQEIDNKGILESKDLANYIAYKYKKKWEWI